MKKIFSAKSIKSASTKKSAFSAPPVIFAMLMLMTVFLAMPSFSQALTVDNLYKGGSVKPQPLQTLGPDVPPGFQFQSTEVGTIRNVNDVVTKAVGFVNIIMYFLIAAAVVIIIYNVVMYIIRGDGSEDKKAALYNVGWGILGLAIILSIWGLVNIVTGTVKVDNNVPTRDFPTADFIHPAGSGTGE